MKRFVLSVAAALSMALPAHAQTAPCGGSFATWLDGVRDEARARGHSANTINRFLQSAQIDQRTLKADRAQGIFKSEFIDFSRRIISQNRMVNGQRNAKKYASIFAEAERRFGIPPGVILAFWALETDFGGFQGDYNTLNSLLTLSHDCRRPGLFRPQIFAALELFEKGDFDPVNTTGAWAGEIGMVQMLPEDILTNGVDGDGDGRVDLKRSQADALLSGAKMLKSLGWTAGQPWMQEVTLPRDLDWSKTGISTKLRASEWERMGVRAVNGKIARNLPASIVIPQGHKGPAFITYPNFDVYFEWNQSFIYVTTAAYFATRLSGAPVYNPGNPDTGLNDGQMKALQQKLQNMGYDVGKIDGILGARTRAAVQKEQARLGLPADAWPTPALLNRL